MNHVGHYYVNYLDGVKENDPIEWNLRKLGLNWKQILNYDQIEKN